MRQRNTVRHTDKEIQADKETYREGGRDRQQETESQTDRMLSHSERRELAIEWTPAGCADTVAQMRIQFRCAAIHITNSSAFGSLIKSAFIMFASNSETVPGT